MQSETFFTIYWLVVIAFYAYFALCLQYMAKKTDTDNAWMAWVPIANMFLLISIAGKPVWWFLLFLIPLVDVIVAILVWMGVAERCGKPSWLGVLMIIPVVNLVIPGYLAFSKEPPLQNFIDGYAQEPQHRTIPHIEPPTNNDSDFPDNKPIA